MTMIIMNIILCIIRTSENQMTSTNAMTPTYCLGLNQMEKTKGGVQKIKMEI